MSKANTPGLLHERQHGPSTKPLSCLALSLCPPRRVRANQETLETRCRHLRCAWRLRRRSSALSLAISSPCACTEATSMLA